MSYIQAKRTTQKVQQDIFMFYYNRTIAKIAHDLLEVTLHSHICFSTVKRICI